MDPRQELQELRRLEELESRLAEQDLGEVRKQQQRAQANVYAGQDVSKMSAPMRFLGGAKSAWDRAAMGLKGMVTDLTPEDRALLEQGKAFREQADTAGTVGNIAGDIALTAAPALRAQQAVATGARYLPRAMQFVGRGVPSSAVAGGATSAALAPEDRSEAAFGGAAGGALGQASGQILTKALGGMVSGQVTPAARQLMDQGAFVPMWKASENKKLRTLAERGRAYPIAGDIIKSQERAGIESWNKILMKEATPPTFFVDDAGVIRRSTTEPVPDVGTEGLNKLASKFDNAYGTLYGNRGVPVDDMFKTEVGQLSESTRRYMPSVSSDVDGMITKVNDILAGPTASKTTRTGGQPVGKGLVSQNMKTPLVTATEPGREVISYNALKEAIDTVDKGVTAAWRVGNSDKAEALMALRDSLRQMRTRGLPPEVQSMGDEINQAYAKFKTIERAAGTLGAQRAGGVVTPGQQLSSIRARDKTPNKSAFSRGNAPGQRQALTAQEVYGSTLPEVGPGTAEKLMPLIGFGLPMMGADAGMTALLGTQTGQRFLTGGLPMQASFRRYGNEYLVPALRAAGTALGD
jgi:hypothetical protein